MQIGAARLETRKGAAAQEDRHGPCSKKISELLGPALLSWTRLGSGAPGSICLEDERGCWAAQGRREWVVRPSTRALGFCNLGLWPGLGLMSSGLAYCQGGSSSKVEYF